MQEVAERHRLSEGVRYVPTDGSVGAGVSAAFELFARSPLPTAVLCLNEMIAAGIMRVAQRRGVRVPEDVSIIASNGSAWRQRMEPALSTMSPPGAAAGEASVKLVLERVRGLTSTTRHVTLKYEFVERLSTGRRALAKLA